MKTVIEMPRAAGFAYELFNDIDGNALDVFAALVREDERKEQALQRLSDIHQEMEQKDIDCPCGSQCIKCSAAVLAEREACAKVCDEIIVENDGKTARNKTSFECAAAIRARGGDAR